MVYDASSIEVLTGLEPVRKRPGMYTATERPDHLAQEVIDNAVDEAIAGYCSEILVTLHGDGSLAVSDDGRGMPVDLHKGEKLPGVEVILTRLHSGAIDSFKAEKRYLHKSGTPVWVHLTVRANGQRTAAASMTSRSSRTSPSGAKRSRGSSTWQRTTR